MSKADADEFTMTPRQKQLLEALERCGGIYDRFGRITASGEIFTRESVIWAFLRGWIVGDGHGRVWLTGVGFAALFSTRLPTPMYSLENENDGNRS